MSGGATARVLYQRFPAGGAFDCIDDGYIAGYAHSNCVVEAWTDAEGEPSLADRIREFSPTHIVACLHNPDRSMSRWTGDGSIDAILACGAHCSVRMQPPEVAAFFEGAGFRFQAYPEFGVSSYYARPPGLTSDEERVLRSGAVSLVRSPLDSSAIGGCFASVLAMGVPVLEEPHAADIWRYHYADPLPEREFAASFVGRCWPFKWSHMEPYVRAMQDAFGDRFAIFGGGWPEGVSRGSIDDAHFARVVASSSVCLSLHEPTQVMDRPFAQNERVFKLLSMGACVVSDANPMLAGQFEVGEELLLAPTPEAMVEQVRAIESDQALGRAIAAAGRTRVLVEHTYAHRAQRLLALAADPPAPGRVITRLGESIGVDANVR